MLVKQFKVIYQVMNNPGWEAINGLKQNTPQQLSVCFRCALWLVAWRGLLSDQP